MQMDFDERLSLLRDRYAASLASKRTALAAAWHAFRDEPGAAGVRAELRGLLHRLAGSAPAYGYQVLGDAATLACAELGPATRDAGDEDDVADDLAPLVANVLDELDRLTHEARPLVALAARAQAPLRVILLEDDDDQAAAIEAALVAHGCTVRPVARAESMWQALTTWPCDALIVDYWLGTGTADDVVRLVREEPSFSAIALVCLTVETDAARWRGMLEHGCDEVLSKSEPASRIVAAIEAAVAARRAR